MSEGRILIVDDDVRLAGMLVELPGRGEFSTRARVERSSRSRLSRAALLRPLDPGRDDAEDGWARAPAAREKARKCTRPDAHRTGRRERPDSGTGTRRRRLSCKALQRT